MSNKTRTVFYIGVTGNLGKRIAEHRSGTGGVFTSKYNCPFLLYYEQFATIEEAIRRETLLKRWKREWKENLIAAVNPGFEDIFDSLF